MTSRFFRFLSKRGPKSSSTHNQNQQSSANVTSNISSTIMDSSSMTTCHNQTSIVSSDHITTSSTNKHVKLNGCEDLRESIEHYNQRCAAIKQLKEREELERQQNPSRIPQSLSTQTTQNNTTTGGFLSFKSFNSKLKNKSSVHNQANQQPYVSKDSIECAVIFLDDQQENFILPKKSLAAKLYEQVFYHLDLIETDYFGLQFSDTHNVRHWLDPTKPIKKQCKIGPPYQFFFKVKFYTAEPNNLKEELTRYFYFLQLKHDLRCGRLSCSTQEPILIELCALILQEELGDYDQQIHTVDTVSEFRFLPDSQQTESIEEKIFERFSTSSAHKGRAI